MDLLRLATLKAKLLKAREFSEILSYFLDHFGESSEFMALGVRADDPALESIVGQVVAQMFGNKVTLIGLLLTRLAEHKFVHGGCLVGGNVGTVLYFEDICTGLVSVAIQHPPETKFARFKGRLQSPASMN